MCTSSSVIINTKVDTEIKQILTEKNINADYDIELSDGSSKGDGYVGIMTRVQIKPKDTAKPHLDLIVKRASDSEAFREKFPLDKVFQSEIHMYKNVFPVYRAFEIENGLIPSSVYPRSYCTIDEYNYETIIMENIRSQGFQLHEKENFNRAHLDAATYECSRLHALSFALRHRQPEKFQDILPPYSLFAEFSQKIFRQSKFDLNFKTLSILDPVKDAEAIEKFRSCYIDNYDVCFETLKEASEGKHAVIMHGDLWQSNIMFKYEDPSNQTKPSEVRLFDYQAARLGPPVLDLVCLFYSACSLEVYEDVDRYLTTYHEAMSGHLKALKCDSSELYPFEVLKQQWKTFAKFSVMFTVFLAQARSTATKNDLVDYAEVAESGGDFESSFSCKSTSNDRIFGSIMRPLVLHLAKNNFL